MPKISDWQPDTFEINMGDMLLSVVDANEYLEDIRTEMHFHSVFEFQYIQKGSLNMDAAGKEYLVQEGEYVIIPPNCFHSPKDSDREKFAFLFSVNFMPKTVSDASEYRYYNRIFGGIKNITVHKNSTVSDCVNRLALQEKGGLATHRMKILFGMLFMAVSEDLMAELSDDMLSETEDINETAYRQKLRGVVGDYISRFCNEDDILSSVARILHMSERNTARIIKEIFGVPISILVLNQRMVYANELIFKTEMSLSDVAEKVGYKHYNTFYKAFKKYYGVSPEEKSKENLCEKTDSF